MGGCKQSYGMIPVLILLFAWYSQGAIIGDHADYRKSNLSSIPGARLNEEDANSVTKLIFSHNVIEYLQESDFQNLQSFPNTRYLFLDNNKIQNIYEYGFSRLQNLKHLDLSHNQLTRIPDELRVDLQKLPALNYINLKRNPIEDFRNIYGLIDAGIDVDFDGMSGVNRRRRLVTENDGPNKIRDHEILDHDQENKTITDKPRKAFVRDNKNFLPPAVEEVHSNAKFWNSIVFNFVAAGLVLLVLPMGMIVYYLVNKNRQLYS